MTLWSPSCVLWFGYPPLIAYFVATILYTVRNSAADSIDTGKRNERNTFFFLPQYLTIVLFPLFHLIISIHQKRWTVILAQIISLFFTYFAGGSLYPIALFTDGFKLQDRISDSAILGLILLIVIQFYGYSAWPYSSLQGLRSHNRPTSRHNSRYVIILYFSSVCLGVLGLVMYTGCAIANWYWTDNTSYKKFICSSYSNFCIGIHYIPVVLFPIMVVLEGLYITQILGFQKRRWMTLIFAPLNSLLGLFLGYNLYLLSYTLGAYYQLPFAKFLISHLSLKLFISQFAAGIIMIISMNGMSVAWALRFWSDLMMTEAAEISQSTNRIEIEESRALIPNSSEYYNSNELLM